MTSFDLLANVIITSILVYVNYFSKIHFELNFWNFFKYQLNYIFEEITEYIELTAKGYCKCMKWENIRALLRLAVSNKRLKKQQAEFLEKES